MTLHLDQRDAAVIAQHADSELPSECCGVLLGHRAGQAASARGNRRAVFSHRDEVEIVITRVIPARNIAAVDPVRSYQVGWDALLEAHRHARQGSGEIVGFYHSHPDGSAAPSVLDAARAWPGYVYLIASAARAVRPGHTAWCVCRLGAPFRPVQIVLDRRARPVVLCAS